jgi:DNA-binding transcriptional ArsR family regulator
MAVKLRVLLRVSELRAVGDPIRIEVLRLLGADLDRALTAKELAAELDVRLSLMHYHLKVLRDEQLVLAESVDNEQGRRERRFRAAQSALRWEFPEGNAPRAGPAGCCEASRRQGVGGS